MLLDAVPVLWSATDGSAAFLLHGPQDFGLLVAGLLWLGAWIHQRLASDLPMAA